MDLVYASAEITITATASSTPDHELLGIGSRPQIPQPAVEVQDELLASSLPNPKTEVEESKWIERARTYQEGTLSRRRPIFIERQIYFECQTMHCCKAIDTSLDAINQSDKQECNNDILPRIFHPDILGNISEVYLWLQSWRKIQGRPILPLSTAC